MDGKEVMRDDADEPELILFALSHHLKALAHAPREGFLSGLRTPTLHGQVKHGGRVSQEDETLLFVCGETTQGTLVLQQ